MQGKIVVYSDQTGIGKIITPEHRKYNFTIDAWNEYDTLPQIGQQVTFEPEGINAFDIALASKSAKSQAQSAAVNTTPPSKKVPPKEPAPSKEKSNVKETSQDKSGTTASLEPTLDVESAIQIHFHDILQSIAQNKELLEENRRLDFIRMNRFLTTAYNNLIEIDHSFENYALAEVRQQLLDAYDRYRTFRAKSAHIQNAYEQVFLKKQVRYKEIRARLELNRSQIAQLNENAKNRNAEIEEKNKRLRTLDPKSEAYIYLFNEIKLLKRTMVDAIHEVGKLTEENRLYIDLLDNFYKLHYDNFRITFEKFTKENDAMLRKIQDVLAYRFDAMLWKRANASKPIQNFFAQAGITDEFSAVTYLKYYLKSLDTSKLNTKNQELLDLLNYLEQQAKKRILGIDDDIEFLTLVRTTIGEIDRDIKVTLASRPETVLPNLRNLQPSILILNPEMHGIDAEAVVGYARNVVPDIEVALFSRRISRKFLMQAKELGATAIIPKTLHRQELLEQFRQYID